MDEYAKDIEVAITVLSAEEGGHPLFSGYRAQFYYDGRDWDAEHHYPDVVALWPGQTGIGYLTFVSPECQSGQLYPGKEFLVREGHRVIARGRITKMLDLEQSAAWQRVQPGHKGSCDP